MARHIESAFWITNFDLTSAIRKKNPSSNFQLYRLSFKIFDRPVGCAILNFEFGFEIRGQKPPRKTYKVYNIFYTFSIIFLYSEQINHKLKKCIPLAHSDLKFYDVEKEFHKRSTERREDSSERLHCLSFGEVSSY